MHLKHTYLFAVFPNLIAFVDVWIRGFRRLPIVIVLNVHWLSSKKIC